MNRRPWRILSLLMAALAYAGTAAAAEFQAASSAEIDRLAGTLRPGDTVVLADGTWLDQRLVLQGQGTVDRPILFRAATPGKVVLRGRSSVEIVGEHLVASGLWLDQVQVTGDGVKLAGRHCRLTDSAITGGDAKFFVHFHGTSNRMDRCYLAGKTNDAPTLQVEVDGRPNGHRIDHNHFGPRPPLGRNGGETIRVGYSHQSMTNSATAVEENLFDRCDGEIEIISNKSCENTYRANTFLECAGMLTLRHGNRCVVDGNFFLGHHKPGSGGIRVIGEGHLVCNNYIESVTQGGFWVTAGISNSPLNGYFQARDCVIAFNTVIDSGRPCVELDAGFGTARRTLRPEKITLANNLFVPATNGVLLKGAEGKGFVWLGNLVAGPGPFVEHAGVKASDAKLARAKDGLWRPAPDSAVRGAAEGRFPQVMLDMDGQARLSPADVGSDQLSEAPGKRHPLNAAEVGPRWMDRSR